MTRISNRTSGFETTEFDNLAKKLLDEYHVPGVSLAVVENGKVSSKAFGLANVESKTPAHPETLYYIGSITKGFHCTALVKYIASEENLRSKKKITLKTPLSEVIPDDFVLPDVWATRNLTFEDALSHRTGEPRHDLSYGGSIDNHKAVVRNLRNLPMATSARSKYDYCNTMFVAAGHALETVTGNRLSDTIKKLVLDPLGMDKTYSHRDEALKKSTGYSKLHHGYRWIGEPGPGGKGEFREEPALDFNAIAPAGYLISSVLDMAKWCKAWLGQSDAVNEEVREEIIAPRSFEGKRGVYKSEGFYGLGLSRRRYRGLELIMHTGGLNGYTSWFTAVPEKNWAFIGLGNGNTAFCAEEELLYNLLDNLLGIPEEDRYDFGKENVKLIKQMTTKDLEAGKKYYPLAPTQPIDLALPLEKYTGTYRNAGYGDFTFEVFESPLPPKSGSKSCLQAIIKDKTWPATLQLFHVTGEYWVGYNFKGYKEEQGLGVDDFKAMTKVGVDGKVQALGMVLEEMIVRDNWEESLIWFEKVTT